MLKTKTLVVLACFLTAASWYGFAQTTLVPQLKDPSIPPRTVPGAINPKILNAIQPKVIVKTLEVKNIKDVSATVTYSVAFEGLTLGIDIRASAGGAVVGRTSGPTVDNTALKFGVSKACAGSPIGCSDITGLKPSSLYFVRAYYTITEGKITGTFYGNELTFTTLAAQPAPK